MSQASTGRVAELDAIRAFAATAILLYHGNFRTGLRPADIPFKMGWTSVDLFFLLSGYLITSIILAHRVDGRFLVSFYARRGLRIWPIYYLAILGLVGLSASGVMPASWPEFSGRLVLHYATFTQAIPSYWGDHSAFYPPIGHFWSLAVEEQFYLAWPFLIWLLGRRGVVPMALAFIAAGLAYRECSGQTSRHLLLYRCDGLAFGAILATLASRDDFRARRSAYSAGFAAVSLASAALIVACTLLGSRTFFWSNSILAFVNPLFFGLVGLVVCQAGHPLLAPLRARWLCYLGTISYGLYLYHLIVYAIVDAFAGIDPLSDRLLWPKLALTLGVAVVSWEFYEKPILSRKDRFPYRAPESGEATIAAEIAPRPASLRLGEGEA